MLSFVQTTRLVDSPPEVVHTQKLNKFKQIFKDTVLNTNYSKRFEKN